MKLVILGSTGLVGRQLVDEALAVGHEVTAVARRAADMTVKHARLKIVEAQATSEADMQRVLPGHDAVLSAIGSRTRAKNTVRRDTVAAVVPAMKAAGIQRLVWISASGVGESLAQAQRSSFMFGRIIIPLMLKHVFADAAVAERMLEESGLEWISVRAVGLNDAPARGTVDVVPLDQKIPRAFIPRADVARFMLEQVTNEAYVKQHVTIC